MSTDCIAGHGEGLTVKVFQCLGRCAPGDPDTIMPGFYVTEGLHRVAPDFAGKPILSAEQVEDIVAYLLTLNES